MTDVHALSEWIAGRLLDGSVQAALIVGLVWLVCRRVTSMAPSAQAMLWWLASLKLVLALLAIPSLPLPVLPAEPIEPQPNARVPVLQATVAEAPTEWPAGEVSVEGRGAASPARADAVPWAALLAGVWLFCVTAQAWRLLRSLRLLRGIVRRSTPLEEDVANMAARLAGLVGLAHVPEVRVSDEIDAPQVVGLRHPVILFPADVATSLTPDERAMALCHELMHVRRRDLAMGWVPALAERLFFFHPMARLAAREYVVAREAACDAAVVRALDVAPTDYGRLILRFGVARSEPAFTAGGSSPSISSLRRRLDMLHHTAFGSGPRRSTWLVVGVMALALLPFQLVARTPDARPPGGQPVAMPASAPVATVDLDTAANQEAVTTARQIDEKVLEDNVLRELEKLASEKALVDKLHAAEVEKAIEAALQHAEADKLFNRQRTEHFLQEELAKATQAHGDLLLALEKAHDAQLQAEAQGQVERDTRAFDALKREYLKSFRAQVEAQQESTQAAQEAQRQAEQESAQAAQQARLAQRLAVVAELEALRRQLSSTREENAAQVAQLRQLEAQLAQLSTEQKKGLKFDEDSRQKARELLEATTPKKSAKLGEPQSLEAQARMLTAQLERLARAQEQLVQQQDQLRRAQEQLVATQRELAAQAERLRQVMEKSQNK